MAQNTLVYWYGIIGIPGKGPNWMEQYNPNKTIGEIIQTLTVNKLGERNKRIEIFKHAPGNMSKYDSNNMHWDHNTTLSEYLNIMGLYDSKNIMLVYVVI
uniref:Uncharacterized protein n=1 Tax=viral metagenome TaxID=1070528 RepID=A0A6C0H7K8_9ZZZZ